MIESHLYMFDTIDLNIKIDVIIEWVMLNSISFTYCLLNLGEIQLHISHFVAKIAFISNLIIGSYIPTGVFRCYADARLNGVGLIDLENARKVL